MRLKWELILNQIWMTKDGFLVVRHEPMLSGTTNVSEITEFVLEKNQKFRW
jgi:glycerophosphoryl diester phosphodiesterase